MNIQDIKKECLYNVYDLDKGPVLVLHIELEKASYSHRKSWTVHFYAATLNDIMFADNMFVGDFEDDLVWNGYKPLKKLPFDHLLARSFFRQLFNDPRYFSQIFFNQ